MCGRFACARSSSELERIAGARRWADPKYTPSSNVCPGRQTPVVRCRSAQGADQELALELMTFGLVPSYTAKDSKPDFFRLMNARSESARESTVFGRLVSSKRCAVLVDGFYEWLPEKMQKQPFFVCAAAEEPAEPDVVPTHPGAPLLWLAALHDAWFGPEGERMSTYTILTQQSCAELRWLHERQPVILGTSAHTAAVRAWLDVEGTEPASALAAAFASPTALRWHRVHPRMSNIKYVGGDAHLAYSPTPITSFFAKAQARDAAPSESKPDDAAPRAGGENKSSADGSGAGALTHAAGMEAGPSFATGVPATPPPSQCAVPANKRSRAEGGSAERPSKSPATQPRSTQTASAKGTGTVPVAPPPGQRSLTSFFAPSPRPPPT
jgi:putative SOS response-associated peptidase YedK